MAGKIKERLESISIRSLSASNSEEKPSPKMDKSTISKPAGVSASDTGAAKKRTMRVTLSDAAIQRISALRLSSKYETYSRSRLIEEAINLFLSTEENKELLSKVSQLIR